MAVVELKAYQTWLTSRINSSAFNTTVSPFAQRSQQYIKESLGQSDEKVRFSTPTMFSADGFQTQLPAEYTDLEKRVDALKQVHQKLLEVTYGSPATVVMCSDHLQQTIQQ